MVQPRLGGVLGGLHHIERAVRGSDAGFDRAGRYDDVVAGGMVGADVAQLVEQLGGIGSLVGHHQHPARRDTITETDPAECAPGAPTVRTPGYGDRVKQIVRRAAAAVRAWPRLEFGFDVLDTIEYGFGAFGFDVARGKSGLHP